MKLAFIIADVQTNYVENPFFKEKFQESKEYINYVSRVFRKYNQPVIHIRHIEESVDPNTKGLEISKEIIQEKSDIHIIKHLSNAFYKTELEKLLKKEEVDYVIISGLSAIHCVLATFNGAEERGFKASFLKSGIIGSKEQVNAVENSFSVISYDVLEYFLSK